MTNADKIRLIASKMPWRADMVSADECWWVQESDSGVFEEWMARDDKLTPAGAPAVRKRMMETGCDFVLLSWTSPDNTTLPGLVELIAIRMDEEYKSSSRYRGNADTEEDATRDAAAEFWRDNAHRIWSEDEREGK